MCTRLYVYPSLCVIDFGPASLCVRVSMCTHMILYSQKRPIYKKRGHYKRPVYQKRGHKNSSQIFSEGSDYM
jgi:hypothetical protein